jgi:hypothetical protein
LSASILYKVSAVLLVLFALGHTLGFRKVHPKWNAEGVISGMRSVSFSFATCFVVITALTWRYFFVAPGVFSSLVALGLVGAAWMGA